MPRRPSSMLTEAELRIMAVLWQRGRATVREVLEDLEEPLAYNTVLTILRILERKGYVRHKQRGRAFVYFPIVQPAQVRRRVLQYVLSRFFENSPELLLANLLQHEQISPETWQRLKHLLESIEE